MHIDWTEPVALFQIGTLHHHTGERHRPAEIGRLRFPVKLEEP
jgi:hypothetical protein